MPETLEPQSGWVEVIRMVYNNGMVDTWNQDLQLSPALAGQYVRICFNVTGKPSDGYAVYQQRKNIDILVATFKHNLDAPHSAKLYGEVKLVEFPGPEKEKPPTILDEQHLANQQSRIVKGRSRLERRLQEEAAKNSELHDGEPR